MPNNHCTLLDSNQDTLDAWDYKLFNDESYDHHDLTAVVLLRNLRQSTDSSLNDMTSAAIQSRDGNCDNTYSSITMAPRCIVGKKKKCSFRPFNEARLFIRGRNMKSRNDYLNFRKSPDRPADIPTNPEKVYCEDWISWGDFLGTGTVHTKQVHRDFLKMEEAMAIVKPLNLRGKEGWRSYCKSHQRPSNIPSNPQATYRYSGWQSWSHFLGNTAMGKSSSTTEKINRKRGLSEVSCNSPSKSMKDAMRSIRTSFISSPFNMEHVNGKRRDMISPFVEL